MHYHIRNNVVTIVLLISIKLYAAEEGYTKSLVPTQDLPASLQDSIQQDLQNAKKNVLSVYICTAAMIIEFLPWSKNNGEDISKQLSMLKTCITHANKHTQLSYRLKLKELFFIYENQFPSIETSTLTSDHLIQKIDMLSKRPQFRALKNFI